MNQEQVIAYLEDVRDEWDAVDKLTKAVDALKDAHSRITELAHHIETIEHGWSSALSSPHRWATEPIPFPRRRNDVYRIQTDYMRTCPHCGEDITVCPSRSGADRCMLKQGHPGPHESVFREWSDAYANRPQEAP